MGASSDGELLPGALLVAAPAHQLVSLVPPFLPSQLVLVESGSQSLAAFVLALVEPCSHRPVIFVILLAPAGSCSRSSRTASVAHIAPVEFSSRSLACSSGAGGALLPAAMVSCFPAGSAAPSLRRPSQIAQVEKDASSEGDFISSSLVVPGLHHRPLVPPVRPAHLAPVELGSRSLEIDLAAPVEPFTRRPVNLPDIFKSVESYSRCGGMSLSRRSSNASRRPAVHPNLLAPVETFSRSLARVIPVIASVTLALVDP